MLVVDDDEPLLRAIQRALRGREVATAETAEQARQIARTMRPEVAVVDVHLGGTSGLDLIRELKHESPDLVAIAYTANLTLEVAFAAGRAGADRAASKSRPIAQLVTEVSEAASRHHVERPTLQEELEELKLRRVQEALVRYGGNISRASQALGMSRVFVQQVKRRLPAKP